MSVPENYAPGVPTGTGFQKGHPKFGGRRRGSKNRFGGDLGEAVVGGIQDGPPQTPTGRARMRKSWSSCNRMLSLQHHAPAPAKR